MDVGTTAQVLTMVLAAAAIIWNQQRSIAALRREIREEIGALRAETREEIGALRAETREEIGALRREMREGIEAVRRDLAAHGERLARIEGYFGIDMPAPSASLAAGAAIAERMTPPSGG